MVGNFVRGDTVSWPVTPFQSPSGDIFSPADCELEVFFRGPTKTSVIAAREDGRWLVSLTTAQSQKLDVGVYEVFYRFTVNDKRTSIRMGRVRVERDPEDPLEDDEDGRTLAEKALEQAENALRLYNAQGQRVQSYSINNRSMTFSSASEILEVIRYWRRRVMAERHGGRTQIQKVAFV